MNNSTKINHFFKKKFFKNLKKNKKNYFSDGTLKVFYKDINKRLFSLENFLEKKKIRNKKILAVIYNQTGINFWINFLISYMSDMTVMPLEKNNKNFKKKEKYLDVVILFN